MTEREATEIQFIREVAVRYLGRAARIGATMASPADVAAFMRRVVREDAREHLSAIYLDGRHRPIAYQIVSIGTATASLVHPREVFQPAVLTGACAVLVAHNHPSGDPTPSREDLVVTRRLAHAGSVLGIALLDHVVWTRDEEHTSIRELEPDTFSQPAAS